MNQPYKALLVFLAAFLISIPATTTNAKAEDAKAEDAKAEDAKAEGTTGGDAKAEDAKAEGTTGGDAKAEGTTGGDAKAEGTTGGEAEAADEKAEIDSDEEAFSAVKKLLEAVKGGQWNLAVALGLMLLVYLMQRFGLTNKLNSKAIPWVAAGLSITSYVSASLMVEGTAMLDAVLGGFATGAAAVGLWEMLFKHIINRSEED